MHLLPSRRVRSVAAVTAQLVALSLIGFGVARADVLPPAPPVPPATDPAVIKPLPVAGQFFSQRARVMDADIAANATTTVKIAGANGLPASGLALVQINLSGKGGWFNTGTLNVYASDAAMPGVTALSYNPNFFASNQVVSKVGADGQIKITNTSSQSVHVYADVHGYTFSQAATSSSTPVGNTYSGLAPSRVLTNVSVPAWGNYEFIAPGVGGVPSSGAVAVAVKISATSAGSGNLRVYAAGDVIPAEANLDYQPNLVNQNFATTKIGTDGKINIYNLGASSAEINIDVIGYYTTAQAQGATIQALDPARIASAVSIPANGDYTLAPLGMAGIPAAGVSTVGLSLTASTYDSGVLTVAPSTDAARTALAVAYRPGVDTSGYVTALLGSDGKTVVHNAGASPVTVNVDAYAYFADPVRAVTADITGGKLSVKWKAEPGTNEYLLVDDAEQSMVWRGTATSADLPMAAPLYRSLILAAVKSGNVITYLGKVVATAPDPESQVSPMTVVTDATGSDIKWAVNTTSTYHTMAESVRQHRIATADGTVVEVPRSQAATWTTLGQQAAVVVATGPKEVPGPVEDQTSPNAPADVPLTPDPPANETGLGVPIDAGAPVNPGKASTAGDMIANDVQIVPPALDVYGVASIAGLPAPAALSTRLTLAQSAPVTLAGGWQKVLSWVDYETYIPQAKIRVPAGAALACGSLGGQWFAGDDRPGPQHNSGKYRTRVAINLHWSNRQNYPFRDVHSTHRLTPSYEVRTASASGIKFKASQNNGNYAQIFISHDVGNPFCGLTSINYGAWVNFYRNGQHWVYGDHVKMPSHQVYQEDFYYNGSSWAHYGARLMFNHRALNAMCLAALGTVTFCGMNHYQVVQ